MPYVKRRGGLVVGLFPRMVPGYAEELLDDAHRDVVTFRSPPPPRKPEDTETTTADLERALVRHDVLSVEQIADAKKDR